MGEYAEDDYSAGLEEELNGRIDPPSKPKPLRFGDPVVNTSASDDNPQKRGFFVRRIHRSGRMNPGTFIEVTDKRGKFWTIKAEAIQPDPSQ